MKSNLVNTIGVQGSLEPISFAIDHSQIFIIVRWRNIFTLVKVEINYEFSKAEVAWCHELAGGEYYDWAGTPILINFPSVVSSRSNKWIHVISGNLRLILDSLSGELITSVKTEASPSAPAIILNNEILVPEGHVLCGYNLQDFRLTWRRPTPNNQWIFAAPISNISVLQHENEENGYLWNFKSGILWDLPQVYYPTKQPILFGDTVVISSGGYLSERLTAINLSTGVILWEADFRPSNQLRKSTIPLSNPVLDAGDKLIVAHSKPALEKLLINNGMRIWIVDLPAQPTALVKIENQVWVGTSDGAIFLINADTGEVLDKTTISGQAVHIFSAKSPILGRNLTSVIDHLGNIHVII